MSYYAESLSGTRLRRCYEIAPPRVRQYFEAELAFVLDRLRPGDRVLELGCGYGRVTQALARVAARVVGIDNAAGSLALARTEAGDDPRLAYLCMDALTLGFRDAVFDVVVCVQNGICAFRVDSLGLLREALRVTRPGGRLIFSSYAERFWPHRLEWFRLQSGEGLLGVLDEARTGDGVIVCKDGFRSGTQRPADFARLCGQLGLAPQLTEVDGSSLFCVIAVPPHPAAGS